MAQDLQQPNRSLAVESTFPVRYARLLHDYDWMKFMSRTASPSWTGRPSTPETVPLFTSPNLRTGKDDLPLDTKWLGYLKSLNSPQALKFILWPPAGWLNRNDKADSLGFGGNIVQVKETEKESAKVNTLDWLGDAPNPRRVNFETRPDLVHKFTVITRKGKIINPGNGLDVYIFLISRKPLYVSTNRLEFFPRLPAVITVKPTTLPWLPVKDEPSSTGKTIGYMLPLQRAAVVDYAPRGTTVWGRTEQGWIALCWYPQAGALRYFTSWQMKTIPPVPPKKVS